MARDPRPESLPSPPATALRTGAEGGVSEWGVELLNVTTYAERLGYHGDLEPTRATLRALHAAHVATIPFDNLEVFLGRPISLDIEALQDKLVRRRAGGYCYEHNLLFAAALDRIGFTVTRLAARISHGGGAPSPRSHMLLRVEAEGESWLADVGFGGAVLAPIRLTETTVRQGAWTYRLERGDDRAWLLGSLQPDGDWATLYTFTLEAQHQADYVVANYFTATHPSSPFTRGLLALRTEADARYQLRDLELTVTRPGRGTEVRILSADRIPAVLKDTFRTAISPEDAKLLRTRLDRDARLAARRIRG